MMITRLTSEPTSFSPLKSPGSFAIIKLTYSLLHDNKKDYYNARRIINRTDRADQIALLARKWERALRGRK